MLHKTVVVVGRLGGVTGGLGVVVVVVVIITVLVIGNRAHMNVGIAALEGAKCPMSNFLD